MVKKIFAFDLSSTQIQPNTRNFELFEGNTNSSTKIIDILIFSYKTSSENFLIIYTENLHGSPEDICHIMTDAFLRSSQMEVTFVTECPSTEFWSQNHRTQCGESK
jgi:hypothetical protein